MLVYCLNKCIRYWLKLISQEKGTLLNSCYKLLYEKCEQGKQNWVERVKRVLQMYGFGDIWAYQNVTNRNQFLKEFDRRVKDCELQNWSTEITTLPKLHYYSMFKTKFEIEPYLLLSLPRKVQRQLTKYRLSAHNLEIERGRQNNIQREDRLCKLCERNYNKEESENEFHFLLECPFYKDVRAKFNCMSFDKTLYNFRHLLTCTDERVT